MKSVREEVFKEAGRVEEYGFQASTRHLVASSRYADLNLWLGVPGVLVSALAGATVLLEPLPEGYSSVVGGILALLVTALTAVTTFLDPSKWRVAHQEASIRYGSLANRACMFRNVLFHEVESDGDLIKGLEQLAVERDELDAKGPPVPSWAYRKARKAAEENELDQAFD